MADLTVSGCLGTMMGTGKFGRESQGAQGNTRGVMYMVIIFILVMIFYRYTCVKSLNMCSLAFVNYTSIKSL